MGQTVRPGLASVTVVLAGEESTATLPARRAPGARTVPGTVSVTMEESAITVSPSIISRPHQPSPPVTGECSCPAGWRGQQCEVPCDNNTFGLGCAYTCSCHPDHSRGCDHVTGECSCRQGWRGERSVESHGGTVLFAGVRCDSICSSGRYGSGCNSQCYCENGSCDPQTGQCQCDLGFTGAKCHIPCSPGFYGVNCRQACPPCNSSKEHQNGLFPSS